MIPYKQNPINTLTSKICTTESQFLMRAVLQISISLLIFVAVLLTPLYLQRDFRDNVSKTEAADRTPVSTIGRTSSVSATFLTPTETTKAILTSSSSKTTAKTITAKTRSTTAKTSYTTKATMSTTSNIIATSVTATSTHASTPTARRRQV